MAPRLAKSCWSGCGLEGCREGLLLRRLESLPGQQPELHELEGEEAGLLILIRAVLERVPEDRHVPLGS